MEDKLPRFVKKALICYKRRSYVGAIISGEFAVGKTVTAIKIGAYILQVMYNYTEKQAIREMIDKYIIFTSDEFNSLNDKLYGDIDWEKIPDKDVLKIKFNRRYAVLVWDDAGIHANTKKDIFDKGDSWAITSYFDQIRDITSCMILTVPEEGELMSTLRKYRSNYFLELAMPSEGGGINDRVIHFYKYKRNKRTGALKRRYEWTSKKHSIHLDNEDYGYYDKKRSIAKRKHDLEQKKRQHDREVIKKYQILKKEYLIQKYESEIEKYEDKLRIDV